MRQGEPDSYRLAVEYWHDGTPVAIVGHAYFPVGGWSPVLYRQLGPFESVEEALLETAAAFLGSTQLPLDTWL